MSVSYSILAAAILGFLAGPLLHRTGRLAHRWRTFVDGFAVFGVAGLSAFHLLPEAISQGGLFSAALAVVGILVPKLWDGGHSAASERSETLVIWIGIGLHAALESAALVAASDQQATTLGMALALHRVPVGLLIFSLVKTTHSTKTAWLAIGSLMAASLVGFALGETAVTSLSGQPSAWLQALVAGSLLHVVFGHDHHWVGHGKGQGEAEHGHHVDEHHDGHHHHDHSHHEESGDVASKFWPALGALSGVALVALVLSTGHGHHDHGHHQQSDFISTLFALAFESAPALVVAYLFAGTIGAVITPGTTRWLNRGGSLGRSLKGVVFGLPMPVCSCGVLPIYETLVRRGVPVTAALGFLVATPELGLDAILLTLPLMGIEMTVVRLVAAFAVALLVALAVGTRVKDFVVEASAEEATETRPFGERIRSGLRFGLVELFDHTFPWVVFGLVLAAAFEPLLAHEWLRQLPDWAQVPLFALVGIPAYVCASGATPIAAVAIYMGVSPGAALAFLLAGPATNITTFGVLGRLHGRGAAIGVGVAVTASAIIIGWLTNLANISVPSRLGDVAHQHGSAWQWACLVALAILWLSSLFRQGPRRMIGHISEPMHQHD